MSELDDLRLQRQATQEILDEARGRMDEAFKKYGLARRTIAKTSEALATIETQIEDLLTQQRADGRICRFEDEHGKRCESVARWRIEFPPRPAKQDDWSVYEVNETGPATTSCHEHLYIQADDGSGAPAIITLIEEEK